MNLRSKALRELVELADGKRLLVSRIRPHGAARIDGWERRLAPSVKLDFALYRRWITWQEYTGLYVAEMWAQASLLRELGEQAQLGPVTLVCTCADEQRCHRVLLARVIEQLFVAPRLVEPVAPVRRARARVPALAAIG
jgi:uncharacterized protein YeaO (DUF488 family)